MTAYLRCRRPNGHDPATSRSCPSAPCVRRLGVDRHPGVGQFLPLKAEMRVRACVGRGSPRHSALVSRSLHAEDYVNALVRHPLLTDIPIIFLPTGCPFTIKGASMLCATFWSIRRGDNYEKAGPLGGPGIDPCRCSTCRYLERSTCTSAEIAANRRHPSRRQPRKQRIGHSLGCKYASL